MNEYEFQTNLRGDPDQFSEMWLFWHGMTLLPVKTQQWSFMYKVCKDFSHYIFTID